MRLTSDAGDVVGAVTGCVDVGADAEAAVAARVTLLARVVSGSDAVTVDQTRATSLARTVAVDDVAHGAAEPGSEHGRRHRHAGQVRDQPARHSADEYVAVVAAAELERAAEHRAAVDLVVDAEDGLGPPPPHLDPVPAAVVHRPAERDVHVAVRLVGESQHQPHGAALRRQHHHEEVGPSSVVGVPQQDAAVRDQLRRAEVKGERRVCAAGPRREAGVGRLGTGQLQSIHVDDDAEHQLRQQ